MAVSSELVFFTDQCISGRTIAAAIQKASGCRTEIHRDQFPVDAEDVEWIPEIGRRRWILITKDSGILRKEKERQALIAARVRAFIFKDKLLGRDVTVELINLLMPAMLKAIDLYEAPFIYSIELPGSITPLSDLIPKSPAG